MSLQKRIEKLVQSKFLAEYIYIYIFSKKLKIFFKKKQKYGLGSRCFISKLTNLAYASFSKQSISVFQLSISVLQMHNFNCFN